jgi:hypothetical protein
MSTNILFNWKNGDMDAFETEFGFRFTTVPEMIDGTYLCVVANADDFDVWDEWMEAIGKVEVIGGFERKGKQYKAKKDKNKYKKSKYEKYLRPILDENGKKVKPTKIEVVEIVNGVETIKMVNPPPRQVNNYLGDSPRDLEDEPEVTPQGNE